MRQIIVLTILFFSLIGCMDDPVIGQGTRGTDGIDGADGIEGVDSIQQMIDPCGDYPGPDEILFVMSTGEIVAWYYNLGMVALDPGVYVTTDAQGCHFEITEYGEYVEIGY